MSLKSFPNNIDDRRVVWCLSQDTVDAALNDNSSLELLLAPNITVVQLPLSRIAKKKSVKLCELEKLGLLKVDQVLVCSDEGVNLEEKYLNLEEVIEDFLTYNLKKANAYARFFAALGAISFEFEHKKFDFSKSKADFSVSLDGVASRVTKANIDLTAKVEKTLNQIASIMKGYTQNECATEQRILLAEKILKEYNLENDEICRHELATFKDGVAHLSDLNISMSSTSDSNRSINILVDVGLNFPNIETEGKSSSLISFKSKLELASIVKNSFDFNLKVKF
ncbi:TPA: hypothetical protein R7S05_003784 [Acinetobacter baumannii]|uniref:hypothetical protein n=1 Tax=Acinetobacter baumannii TaxID=470 RepID=UPI0002CEA748|nr:hypothetical protein [Acinetobacter baumannii]ENW65965.1 hypothetical protein F915_00215 [Acinetobacter baumannii NIPH 70]MDB0078980.1 hypothetical protein [Acinetobacter baumannii]MDB0152613.1 hypothetical protein [Acinetobacter baumannii]MDB0299771.1 hypothetical protein [Acinetobacter baumannii]OIH04256.1 hypothetical protein A7M79_15610 [Acinetobacter baumannii]